MNVNAQRFQSSMSWCVNHWHQSTNERHSLSQPLRADSSLREGAGKRSHSPGYSLKSQVSGDFHRPYRALAENFFQQLLGVFGLAQDAVFL